MLAAVSQSFFARYLLSTKIAFFSIFHQPAARWDPQPDGEQAGPVSVCLDRRLDRDHSERASVFAEHVPRLDLSLGRRRRRWSRFSSRRNCCHLNLITAGGGFCGVYFVCRSDLRKLYDDEEKQLWELISSDLWGRKYKCWRFWWRIGELNTSSLWEGLWCVEVEIAGAKLLPRTFEVVKELEVVTLIGEIFPRSVWGIARKKRAVLWFVSENVMHLKNKLTRWSFGEGAEKMNGLWCIMKIGSLKKM